MNKRSRDKIKHICETIGASAEEVRSLIDDENMKLDSIPENLQSGQLYESIESSIDHMEDAVDSLEEAISELEGACE